MLNNSVKKLARSVEMLVPGSVEAKYALSDAWYARTRRICKPDLNGLRLFETNDALMVDVGSNRGQCIRAFRNIDPTMRMVAFEPVPFLADKLKA